MHSEPRYRDGEWLREQYIDQHQSGYEIAEECGCSANTIYSWLDKHGIKKRPEGADAEQRVKDDRLVDANWVREQYLEKGKSVREIADACGCSFTAARRWLHRHNIEARGACQRPPDQRLTDPAWLREQYVEKSQHFHEIAAKCGCSETAVREWAKKHGIETRGAADFEGRDHPRWAGGPPDYGSGWNEKKRRRVRERDGHTCQDPRCKITQQDHFDEYDEKLHVHHLRKAREVDDPDSRNAMVNLITLCRDCHTEWEKIADAGLVPQMQVADD